MPYFEENYSQLCYPTVTPTGGLYNAQLGAIHSIASHFTVHEQPALVTMPTGSGKTAVLMMTPFVLRSTRVLVITPSRMVREQIAEDFAGLVTLRRAGAIPPAIRSPHVKEVKSRIESADEWTALREFEVIVSTPNCTSPTYAQIPVPPENLFDLVLIDEAHHSSAKTWAELIRAIPASKKVLFTATPFRRDRGEIEARLAYTYPVERAFHDGIFGHIRYVPVEPAGNDAGSDAAIARVTSEALQNDRAAGLNHCVMVRTDTLTRANELVEVYRQHSQLRLALVHSRVANVRIKTTIADLERGELDGIICVNMLGEGFNFPRLKIAAIHAPHKSLEVTLQFIGRFARTNAPDIGEAKFVAVRNDIELEGERLFAEGAVWQEIIHNLAYGRIAEEIAIREALDSFRNPEADDPDLSDLSLYSLHPRSHVKIFDVSNVDVHLERHIRLAHNWQERYRNVTQDADVMVAVYRRMEAPPWSASDLIVDSSHVLLIVYHDPARRLLFINCSESSEGVYEAVVEVVAPGGTRLNMSELRRVVRRLRDQRVFNYGMRNIQATNAAESYRIASGPNASATLSPAEARQYRQGHAFVVGEVDGEKVTIGYSSGSKVWSADKNRIPGLLSWCRAVGQEIRNEAVVVTNSGLDYLPTGVLVSDLPTNIVLSQWHRHAFNMDEPPRVEYRGDDGAVYRPLLMELELGIDRQESTQESLVLVVEGPHLRYRVCFGVSPTDAELYETAEGEDSERIRVTVGVELLSLIDYLNIFYLDLYTADGGVLEGNQLSAPVVNAEPLDRQQLEPWDWTGADIRSEIATTANGISVQDHVRARLANDGFDVVFCDHGSGEIADFVGVKRDGDAITFTLFHCKRSHGAAPGARVEDVYEVCGQAQKSVIWRSLDRIRRRLHGRLEQVEYVRGTEHLLANLLDAADTLRQQFGVVVVQPGISAGGITPALLENLGATTGHLTRAGFRRLRVVVSA
jgi:superfamily II DNA or RNA helicase